MGIQLSCGDALLWLKIRIADFSQLNEGTDMTSLPQLPIDSWRETKETLHRMSQVVGKVRLGAMPHRNHWWHVTLYVNSNGLTTGPMPARFGCFEIRFDLLNHRLEVETSRNEHSEFPLTDVSIAGFYGRLMSSLEGLGIETKIKAEPFDLSPATPFPVDEDHATYDPASVERYLQILQFTDRALKEFYGRFTGKQSPSHLFWHTFDLAMARYSGHRAPDRPEADIITREAYSHEVISFGFWAGDDNIPAPAFYSYTWPEPEQLSTQSLQPDSAKWVDNHGSSLALLMYDDIRTLDNPHDALLDFFQSCYDAGSATAGWDVEALRTVRFS